MCDCIGPYYIWPAEDRRVYVQKEGFVTNYGNLTQVVNHLISEPSAFVLIGE